ncbi:hypothetical protein [Vibrio harveyi]|uniref:hypothetical protein n=1 Tax=Vibrio harveyi TaxID=669 RepID=UPI003BB7128A
MKKSSGSSLHIDRKTALRLNAWFNRNYRISEDAPAQSVGFQARMALQQFLTRDERENDIRFIDGVTNEE